MKTKVLFVLIVLAVAVLLLGPRPSIETNWKSPAIGADPVAYLEQSESLFDDITPGTQKQIHWANDRAEKTPWAIVYLHGFSASAGEINPVVEQIAAATGSNVFKQRFNGHGRGAAPMGEVSLNAWSEDVAEALAIGQMLGQKTLLMATSNGAVLSALALANPQQSAKIDALVMLSPAFALHAVPTWVLNAPWAETILPLALGAERSFEPVNSVHAQYWTHRYPSKAVFALAAGLRLADAIDFSQIKQPLLVYYSTQDKVVRADKIAAFLAAYAGPTQVEMIEDATDPWQHVITGDALSPNTNSRVIETTVKWLQAQ